MLAGDRTLRNFVKNINVANDKQNYVLNEIGFGLFVEAVFKNCE